MSIGKQSKYLGILNGVAWILTGIFGFFDNIPCQVLTIIGLLCSLFLLVRVSIAKKESGDEMSDQNLKEALAQTHIEMHRIFTVVVIVLVAISIFSLYRPVDLLINWRNFIVPAYFVIIGIDYLLTGIHFKQLEEE
jgi:hypothetical protein